MGVVFLGRDVALDRLVAIKLLPPSLAADAELRTRFLTEARTAAGLSHPNIVPIHAVEEHGDLVFFVMGYVDGETLGQRVRRDGPLAPSDVMRIVQEVAWALGHAHARGVIHRDVKPDNVILERETDRVVVTDFGIARRVEGSDTPKSGVIRGTPQYMSPEQAAGGTIDGRSDLYSLGVLAFVATTGRLPFEAPTVMGLLAKHAAEPAPSVMSLTPKLSRRFAAAIDRCLEKDPEARWGSAEDFAQEIASVRGVVVRVPPPITRFLRESEVIGADVTSYLGGVAASAILFETLRGIEGDFFGILFGLEMVFIVVFAALSGARAVQLTGMARRLLTSGYGHRALHVGLELEERREAEEAASEIRYGQGQPWLTAAAGAAVTAIGVGTGVVFDADVTVVLGMAAAIGSPMLTIRRLWSQLGWGKWWRKRLKGKLGRILFRVGGAGLGARVEALPADGERTEVALGYVAEQLFAGLPSEQQARLGDVPAIVARLEADALALREQRDDPQASARLGTAVAALESLRLDLLKLHAGNGSLDELTRNLEAARAIGEEIDAALAGRQEVEALTRTTGTT
jgi:serine/threonine-protein kinase